MWPRRSRGGGMEPKVKEIGQPPEEARVDGPLLLPEGTWPT